LFKLLWIKENAPEIWTNTHRILCFEDLLQYRLGIKNPSMGWPLAGRTMLFDVVRHSWNAEILESLGLRESLLSTPLQSGSFAGKVNKKLCKELNLSENVFIVTGGHDQPALLSEPVRLNLVLQFILQELLNVLPLLLINQFLPKNFARVTCVLMIILRQEFMQLLHLVLPEGIS